MDMMNRANGEALFQLDVQLVNFRLRAKIAFKTWNREYVNALNWLRVWSKSITGIAGSGGSSHMTAIEQSPSLDPERKWKRIVIWMVAALDLAALTILLWTW